MGLEAEKTGSTYGFTETKAPTGYNPLEGPIFITITTEYQTAPNNPSMSAAIVTADNAFVSNGVVLFFQGQVAGYPPVARTTVVNNAGTILPSIGGAGTAAFYAAGMFLLIGAGILFLRRERMSVE